MYLTYEIEYKEGDEFKYLQVDFEADPFVDSEGIGYYEFWGHKGFDKGNSYVTLESDPVWDENLYTDEENRIIKEFQSDPKKWKGLCDAFCDEYTERCKIYND